MFALMNEMNITKSEARIAKSEFASIGVMRDLLRIPTPPPQLLSSDYYFFAMFWLGIFLQKLGSIFGIRISFGFRLSVFGLLRFRGQGIVIKNSLYHIFITKCVKKSISSQKHHSFQNYPTIPRRSRRRESAPINQPANLQ
ncbi:MAG: hypothetical protein WCO56_26215 [Verrucomicrobiota bacterium]